MASRRPWWAIRSRTARVSGRTAPPSSTTGTGGISIPCSRSSSWSLTHTGTLHARPGASRSWDSLTLSTVGSHTVRAPSRAATSTASAFIPPTARLSTIAPSAWIPGTAARTTLARSAVEV